jgi:hypothetical protein
MWGNGIQLRVYSNDVLQSGVDYKNNSAFGNTSTSLVIGNGGGLYEKLLFSGSH